MAVDARPPADAVPAEPDDTVGAAGEAVTTSDAAPGSPDCRGSVSFPELVLAHHDWRQAVDDPDADASALERAYCERLARFEREHGRIVNAYWCLCVASAVALTEKPRRRPFRWLARPVPAFHRVTDWATQNKPEVAGRLHRCDELAIRSAQVLTGLRRRVSLQLVMATASHLLSLADTKSAHDRPSAVLREHEERLRGVEQYYRDAANGQAQMVYFVGMAVFTVAIGCLVVPFGILDSLPRIDDREFFGTLFAGAIGAVVSVVQRINSGRFDLEYDVGRPYPFFLGGLRPLLGGAFGLVFYFAVSSGLLDIVPISAAGTDRIYALLVLAFLAGFSERWAKDTLTNATGVVRVGEGEDGAVSERRAGGVAAPVRPRPGA